MTREPMHEEFFDMLAAEAVGALDGPEREHLLAHLAGCAACQAQLAELRDSAALLAYAAPARPMDPARSVRVRARLLARAAADRDASAAPADDVTLLGAGPPAAGPVTTKADVSDVTLLTPAATRSAPAAGEDATLVGPPPAPAEPARVTPITAARPRRAVAPWLAMAASLALLLGVGAYALALRGRLATLGARYAALAQERGELVRAVQEREATLAAVAGPEVRVIEMAASRPAQPAGRMFWDASTHRWTFFAHRLPQVADGREYQLWLVTGDDRKISAGTFRPDPRGQAVVQAQYELPAGALAAIAVTEEPAGGLPQPSGPIVIAGAAAE